MRPLLLAARARGLTWSVPGIVATVGVGALCAHALESQPQFDEYDRVPAVVLAALVAAFLATSCLDPVDEELDGAARRPTRTAALSLVTALVALGALTALVLIPLAPFERAGAELARNLIGLTGLGLIGAAAGGRAAGWAVPFLWTGISYLSVSTPFQDHPAQAGWGWLIVPATWTATWIVAGGLFLGGLALYAWAGFPPRPRRHPRR